MGVVLILAFQPYIPEKCPEVTGSDQNKCRRRGNETQIFLNRSRGQAEASKLRDTLPDSTGVNLNVGEARVGN